MNFVFSSERCWHNLVPRVSHLTAPWGSLAPGGGKMRDPGNEVGVDRKNNRSLFLLKETTIAAVKPLNTVIVRTKMYCSFSKADMLCVSPSWWESKSHHIYIKYTLRPRPHQSVFKRKRSFFCPRYCYRPHYNAEYDHQKRSHSKTLSRVERFENDAFRKPRFLAWTEKKMLSENTDVIIDSTVSIQNGRQTLPCGFKFRANFAGRYIEMRMRGVHFLTMHSEGIAAFSNIYGVVV